MPNYFRDDWLNDYYDMCRAARSAADAAPRAGVSATRSAAACDATNGGGVNSETLPQAPGLAPSRLADSDYRFVYLGPKVTGLLSGLSCIGWCDGCVADVGVLPLICRCHSTTHSVQHATAAVAA